jgi:hypothetical protein
LINGLKEKWVGSVLPPDEQHRLIIIIATMATKERQPKRDNSQKEWWKDEESDVECPITLELISQLTYPPFILGSSKFDGVALGVRHSSTAKMHLL